MKICDKPAKCSEKIPPSSLEISSSLRSLAQSTIQKLLKKAWGDKHPHIDLWIRAGCVSLNEVFYN